MRAVVAGLVLASLGVLAGCSSGSDGGDGGGGAPDAPLTFAGMSDLAAELDDVVAGLDYTDPASLPASGTATYAGVIYLEPGSAILPDDADDGGGEGDPDAMDHTVAYAPMLGQITLEASFGSDSMTGQAGNFQTEDGSAWTGTLDVTEVEVFRDIDVEQFYTYEGLVGGTLTQGGQSLGVDAGLVGDFLGPHADYTAGVVGGIITDGQGDEYDLNGGFVAEAER